MEWKIGEIRQVNGEWYQCVKGDCCRNCDFYDKFKDDICFSINNCSLSHRCDKTSVIFKKLEKVGEPYRYQGIGIIMVQEYILANTNYIWEYSQDIVVMDCQNGKVAIEIKQNKEDMEEKNDVKQTPLEKLVIDFFNNRVSDIEFEKRVSELYAKHSNSENIGKNLREFDLEAAKAGKPVCTRDGRKARIICFDTKGDPCPIIALVEENGIEAAYHYDKNGQNAYNKSKLDLMMLPEKKEGWVNVYKGGLLDTKSYNTKKEAFDKASPEDYVDTVKINWEE